MYGSSDGADKNRFRISVRSVEDAIEIFDICKSDSNVSLNIWLIGEEAVDLGGNSLVFSFKV